MKNATKRAVLAMLAVTTLGTSGCGLSQAVQGLLGRADKLLGSVETALPPERVQRWADQTGTILDNTQASSLDARQVTGDLKEITGQGRKFAEGLETTSDILGVFQKVKQKLGG